MCSCRRASFERGAALFSVHRPSILQCLFLKSAGAPKSICCLTLQCGRYTPSSLRRRGRVAEGGGLLNRYTLQRRIEGSNPSVSAKIRKTKCRITFDACSTEINLRGRCGMHRLPWADYTCRRKHTERQKRQFGPLMVAPLLVR